MDNNFMSGVILGFIIAISLVILCIYLNDYLSRKKNNGRNFKLMNKVYTIIFLLSGGFVVNYIRYKWNLFDQEKIRAFMESIETFLIWNTGLFVVALVLFTYKGTKSIYYKMKTEVSLWDLYFLILILAGFYILVLGTSSYSDLFTVLFGSILAGIIFIFSESEKNKKISEDI
ncbi:hypothetical protein ACU64V_14630 [Lysinibacillus capsici]